MQRLKLTIIVNVVLIALTISYLYADEREKRVNVKTVKQAVVFDSTGSKHGRCFEYSLSSK